MNYKRVIDRCWEQEQDYFKSLGLTKGMLTTIWDIYYNSLKAEVFNEDRTKLFIQQPNLGIFKHGLDGWQEVLQNFKKATSLGKMHKALKQTGSHSPIIELLRQRYYPFVRKELEIMNYYMECYETYNQGVKRREENIDLYEKGLYRRYKTMNDYQDQAWELLQKVKRREKRLLKKISKENNSVLNQNQNQNNEHQ